jgi:MFS family permease
MIPTLQESALHEAPDEHRAAVMATWTGCARLGQTLGPLTSAAVLSQWGSSWSLLGGAIGGAALLAMFVFGPLRRPARVPSAT